MADTALAAIAELAAAAGGKFLAGPAPSIADLLLAPVIAYFDQTPEGAAAMARQPRVQASRSDFSARPAMQATVPDFG